MTTFKTNILEPTNNEYPVARALVLPGINYPVQASFLEWTILALRSSGWRVATLSWDPAIFEKGNPHEIVLEAAEELEVSTPPAEKTLLITKSISSYAAEWADIHHYPGVYLTPLLVRDPINVALRNYRPESLLVGGIADQTWVSEYAHQASGKIIEIPNVGHPLTDISSWRNSLEILGKVTNAIEEFAAKILMTS